MNDERIMINEKRIFAIILRFIMKIFFILFILLLPLFSLAQQSDSQLAYTYYQNKDYVKAAELFLKLYERTRSSNFLDYHIISLINGKQYDQAEEVLKKYLKADANNKDFLINLGYIYEQQGKAKKSEEYYERAIKKLIPQTGDINSLAYKFRNIRQYGWALKTYMRGRELLKRPDAFQSEMGENYMMERDYENMFALFIQILETKPNEINNITSKLNFARSSDIINSVDGVIEKKLNEIFKKPDYLPVFDELAVWYMLQKKEYNKALQHAIRLNEQAKDKLAVFLNIARNANGAKEYQIAMEAYNKILEKGKENNNYYSVARKGILTTKFDQLQYQHAEQAQYQQMISGCEKYMQEYGYVPENVDIAILLSDIYAYQLQQPDSANHILEKSTAMRRLNSTISSQLKSKRADLLTFMDNPWEATILYTQLEKANPNNDIGYEAKLKKAWLAYYTGDLLWAKAQFDVLKGSTTKLISNDAILMSHFINMNYEADGDNNDLEKLAKTEYLIHKKQIQAAQPILDSLIANSQPGIADYAALKKSELLCNYNQHEKAAEILETLKDHSEQTYIRAVAIFKLANLKKQLQDTPQAKELYKQLVSEYSGSVYSVEAGRLYREIEEK